jgi:hypothetical protein
MATTKRIPAAEANRLRREAYRREEERAWRNEFVRETSRALFVANFARAATDHPMGIPLPKPMVWASTDAADEALQRAEVLCGALERAGHFTVPDEPRPPFRERRTNPPPRKKKATR